MTVTPAAIPNELEPSYRPEEVTEPRFPNCILRGPPDLTYLTAILTTYPTHSSPSSRTPTNNGEPGLELANLVVGRLLTARFTARRPGVLPSWDK